jgi:hypothetical protein
MDTIYNGNDKNMPSNDNYNTFNDFIFSDDTKIIGKMLHKYDFFSRVKDLPGDIVEVGVFKGSGIATFSKFLDIYCPNSNKKIIGFDIFDHDKSQLVLSEYSEADKTSMNIVYSRVNVNDRTLTSVTNRLEKMNIAKKYMLVEGDISDTMPVFLAENPGFRISLLYIDVDLEVPTYLSLKYLWDRVLPGGIIVFDEYEYHKFSESCGVEQFLKERKIKYDLKSTNWITPTSYIVKDGF